MTNLYRNEAPVEIGGENYTLRASLGAMAELEADEKALGLEGRRGVRYILVALKHMSRAGGREIPEKALKEIGVSALDGLADAVNAAMSGGAAPEKN